MCADANNVAAVHRGTKTRYKRVREGEVGLWFGILHRKMHCVAHTRVEKCYSVHKSTRSRKKENGSDKRNKRAPQPVWLASTMTLHLGVLSPASL